MRSVGDPVMSRLGDHDLDTALNESWPTDAATTPDRAPIPVVARVVWQDAGEERLVPRLTDVVDSSGL